MTWPFIIIAGLTAGSAIAAVSLRNLVHCALSLVVTFAGLAALFLQLNAEFVGFAQILVYVGAVAILIVFAILLTRGADTEPPAPIATSPWWGIGIAVAVFLTLAGAVLKSRVAIREPAQLVKAVNAEPAFQAPSPAEPSAPVRAIGEKLMTDYVLPLEVLGLLLTAAMIGAVVIAMQDRKPKSP